MGNSSAVILKHYRQLVKPAAAAAFWNITPQHHPDGKDTYIPAVK
jgi:hypothetical protein